VLNHASNVTGVIQPAKSIAAAAQSAGALCLLDAAQTIGHLPVDLQDIGADLMATAGHKGLLGPLGTGLIYVRAGLDAELRPIRCGGTGTVSELLSQPETMPSKLESGNMNMPGLAGLNAAVQWLLQHDIAVLHDQVTTRTASRQRRRTLASSASRSTALTVMKRQRFWISHSEFSAAPDCTVHHWFTKRWAHWPAAVQSGSVPARSRRLNTSLRQSKPCSKSLERFHQRLSPDIAYAVMESALRDRPGLGIYWSYDASMPLNSELPQ
jgi:hypothetical protein